MKRPPRDPRARPRPWKGERSLLRATRARRATADFALCAAIVCAALGAQGTGSTARAEGPFLSTVLPAPGRVVSVRATTPGPGCEGRGSDLLVLSVSGTPPDDARTALLLACPKPGQKARVRIRRTVDKSVVGVDAGDVDGQPGAELVLLSARNLEIVSAGAAGQAPSSRRWPLPFALPLPRLTRELAHMPMLDDWNGDGRPTALVPSVDGALLVWLDDGSHREIALPIESDYEPSDPSPPGAEREWLRMRVEWPTLMRADDDADGRLDLFAMGRFDVWIFRLGDEGLPSKPTRRLALRPFTDEEELRWQSAEIGFSATDLDGDGRADLVLDKTRGTLLSSHSTTQLYRGGENGVSFVGPPDGSIELEGGIAATAIVDLDGDGRSELFESSVKLGVVQLGRLLITRRASADFRIHRLGQGGELETVWTDSVSLTLDFGTGRIDGLFPDTRGDFDGDGRRDLVVPTSSGNFGVRLGTQKASGPGFGPIASEQELPMKSASLWIADLDGDGLDDLVLWDSRNFEDGVHVLHNRGTLGPSIRDRTP